MSDKLTNKKYWDNFYSKRNFKCCPNPRKYRFHFNLDRYFQKYLPKKKGLKLIEMGCGGSIWLPYFYKEFGYEIFGMDYSEQGCELSRRILKEVECEGEIYCKDFFELDTTLTNYFDVLLSIGVIEHFNVPAEVLRIFSIYLKKGGTIITIVPNMQSIMGKIQKIVDENIYKIHKIFTLEDLKKYHEQSGFKCIEASYFGFLDMNMINISKLPPKIDKVIRRLITIINLPFLHLSRLLNLHISSKKLCSYMIIIAVKE